MIKPRTLYVFDEPERHLHPTAQDSAAQWVQSPATDDVAVVVATHSLSFLNMGSDYQLLACAARLRRRNPGRARQRPVGERT
ncbi:MAG: AAA family ATPase [Gaiellaceae bacterium]